MKRGHSGKGVLVFKRGGNPGAVCGGCRTSTPTLVGAGWKKGGREPETASKNLFQINRGAAAFTSSLRD